MTPDYSDYFVRVMDLLPRSTLDKIRIPIRPPVPDLASGKLINLFIDCFDHHTRCSDHSPATALTPLSEKDPRRYVARDALFTRFLDNYYRPPAILTPHYKHDQPTPGTTISFDDFCTEIQSCPITDPTLSTKLGSNTYTYLIGDVGSGKSLFLAYLYRRLVFDDDLQPYQTQDDEGYTVIPIHIDVDELIDAGGTLRQIDKGWFNSVVDKIIAHLRRSAALEDATDISRFVDPKKSGYSQRLGKLTQFLALRQFRLLLFFDNVDRYHFHYSKYRFTTPYSASQDNSVVGNLRRLIVALTSEAELGFCGLCVVFVCRDYVYNHLRSGCQDKSLVEREFGRVYKIQLVDDYEVMASRMKLFEEAVNVALGDQIAQGLVTVTALKSFLASKGAEDTLRPEIEFIRNIGHHGFRSLVDFIDNLALDVSRADVFDRLLVQQPKNLAALYILNNKQRYSQAANHFPNIFLVDALISRSEPFKLAHKEHRPTYWLKYFVLKAIVSGKCRRLFDVLKLFSQIGDYDEDLVRLVIGSLCSTNESRCIDVDTGSEIDLLSNPELVATSRGRQLVSSSLPFGAGNVDFCLEFNYLQQVVDDILLSLPIQWAERVIVDLDYSYLYESQDKYGEGAWNMVRKKAYATGWFVAILSSALRVELSHMEPLKASLLRWGLLPDMKRVAERLHRTQAQIFIPFNQKREKAALDEFYLGASSRERDMDRFFETVWSENVLVS